jgi:general stress protein YciG
MNTKNENNNGAKARGRGFASMDAVRQREIASKGGKASALGNTSNRGFASMDVEKQREISRKGGQASHRNRDKQGAQEKK